MTCHINASRQINPRATANHTASPEKIRQPIQLVDNRRPVRRNANQRRFPARKRAVLAHKCASRPTKRPLPANSYNLSFQPRRLTYPRKFSAGRQSDFYSRPKYLGADKFCTWHRNFSWRDCNLASLNLRRAQR